MREVLSIKDASALFESIGYVYILHDADNARIKIGYTKHPYARPRSVASAAGVNGYTIWVSKRTLYARRIEKTTHKYFSSSRIKGEWFAADFKQAIKYVEANLQLLSDAFYKQLKQAHAKHGGAFLNFMKGFVRGEVLPGDRNYTQKPIETLQRSILPRPSGESNLTFIANILRCRIVDLETGEVMAQPTE